MARSLIAQTTLDPASDPGSVLFSLVMGEQLEFPVDLSFYPDASQLVFKPVVMESDNQPGQSSPPLSVKTGGASTLLTTRLPSFRGDWTNTVYSRGDLVQYAGTYWELSQGGSYKTLTDPARDPLWRPSGLNRVYVRFPLTLGSNWSQKPTPTSSVYGFVELACTENPMTSFPYTWKPVRGVVELQFSPTQLVT